MQNKIWIVIIIVLLCALASIWYFSFSGQQKIAALEIAALAERVDKEAKRLNDRTAAAVQVGEPVGYVIEFENHAKFYITGDTAPMADMKLVINDYYQPDVAILPIGGTLTMGSKEAAFATSLIQPKDYVIPYHYASYPFLEKTSDNFAQELKKYNLTAKLLTLEVGKEKEANGVKIVWLGHASLLLVSPEGRNILVDPCTKNGLWPEEYKDLAKFGKVDLVLLTHGHPDHTVVSDLDKLTEMYKPVILAQFELGNWLTEHVKVPESVYYYFNKGGTITQNILAGVGVPPEKIGGIQVSMVSASHSSSAVPQ